MNQLFSLHGETVLITGGSRGIGAALAVSLAAVGARVAVMGRDVEALAGVLDRVAEHGQEAVAVQADVMRSEDVDRALAEVVEALGPVSVLVNNAGVANPAPLLEVSEEDWDRILQTNLKGYFIVATRVVPHMIEAGGGKIINVSSIFGDAVQPFQGPYAASKGGVRQLTKVMALEWAPYRILVNALAPGYIAIDRVMGLYSGTEMEERVLGRTPLGRWGLAEDLSGPAIFLASRASDFMTGQTLTVDGGWSIS